MEGESSAVASPFPVPSSSKGHEVEMTKKTTAVVPEMTSSTSMPNLAIAKDGNTKVLPFEFRALEVCLESACRSLEEEVRACIWNSLSGYILVIWPQLSSYLSQAAFHALASFHSLYGPCRNYIIVTSCRRLLVWIASGLYLFYNVFYSAFKIAKLFSQINQT